jgi:hypothetical protein
MARDETGPEIGVMAFGVSLPYAIKASEFCFARDSNGFGLSVIRMALAFGFLLSFAVRFSVIQCEYLFLLCLQFLCNFP